MIDTNDNSVTGRDGFIQGEALIYAIALIQSQVVTSNCLDMCKIVRARMNPDLAGLMAAEVVHFYKHRPNIDPDDEDPAYKGAFNAALDGQLARYGEAA